MIASGDTQGQTVALAGLYQSLSLVQEMARSGAVSDHRAFESSLMSVLRIDVDSALDAYGGAGGIQTGLIALQVQLSQPTNAQAWERARYASNLMVLERSLRVRPDTLNALAQGIAQVAAGLPHQAIDELPQVQALAQLYSTHISPLGPRVMVNGEPSYLRREAVAARIRALLLSAIRAAVMWRQCGGGRLRTLILRRRYTDIARDLMDSSKAPADA